jgi:hypothetical protein
MKKKIISASAAAVAIIVAFSLTMDTQAFGERLLRKGAQIHKSTPFSLTGNYTGTLSGRISLNGKHVWITKNTTLYFLGEGLKKKGTFVNNRRLYVSGVQEKKQFVATMVIVRPAATMVRDDDKRSRDSKYRIPSRSNPNVGVLANDAAQ